MSDNNLLNDRFVFLSFDINDALSIAPIYKHLENSRIVQSYFSNHSDIEDAKEYFKNNNCKFDIESGVDVDSILTTKKINFCVKNNFKTKNFKIRLINNLSTSYETYSARSNLGFEAVLVPGFYSQHLVSANTVAIPIGLPKFDDFFLNSYTKEDVLKGLPIDKQKPVLVFIHDWPQGHTLFRYWRVLVILKKYFNILIKPVFKECKKYKNFHYSESYLHNFKELNNKNHLIDIENQISYINLFKAADIILTDANSDIYLESCLCANLPTIGLQSNILSDCSYIKDKFQKIGVINKKPENLLKDIDYALTQKESFFDARLEYKQKFVEPYDGTSGKKAAEIIQELLMERKNVQQKKQKIVVQKKKRNIVWICIDGLRPDKLYCCGNKDRPKLFIDELLLSGVLFTKVFSASNATGTAMQSVFSSMYLSNMSFINNQEILYITDYLKKLGYSTFMYNDLFSSPPVPLRAFDVIASSKYRVGVIKSATGDTFTCDEQQQFIKQYNNTDIPKFLYIHVDVLHELALGSVCSSEKYENSIVKTSQILEEIIKQYEISKDDLMILTTDHGVVLDTNFRIKDEKFGPRNEEVQSLTFCSFVIPNVSSQKINKIVRSIDIAPTILDIEGYENKIGSGRSLLPIILGEKYRPIWAFRESGWNFDVPQYLINGSSILWSVRTQRYKFSFHLWRNASNWLIDLHKDNDYEKNLIGQGLEIEQILRETLQHNFIDNPISYKEIYEINSPLLSAKDIEPVISIIIPVHEYVYDLNIFLSGIFARPFCYIEVIIIDGDKSLQTHFLLEQHQFFKYPNFFYYKSNSSSFNDLLNKGLEKARGKFSFFALPSIHIHGEHYINFILYCLKNAIEKKQQNILSVSNYAIVKKSIDNNKAVPEKKYFFANISDDTLSTTSNFQCFCSVFLTKTLRKVGGFTNRNTYYHELRQKLLLIGNEVSVPGVFFEFIDNKHSFFHLEPVIEQYSNKPDVSIILPVYDDSKYFVRTVQSFLSQSFENFELIIMCGNKNHHILSILNHFNDNRIRLLFYESNDLSDLLNEGILSAKGEFITWVYSYSFFDPDYLSVFVNTLKENNSISFVYSDYAWIDEGEKVIEIVPVFCLYRKNLVKYRENYSFMYRRSCHQQVGFFDKQLEGIEDWDMFVKILEHYSTKRISKVLSYRLKHVHTIAKKDANINRLTYLFMEKTIIKRYNFVLNIDKLYPFLKMCEDQNFSFFISFYDLGNNFFLEKMYEMAISSYKIAISKSKKDYKELSFLKTNLALACIMLNQWDEAVNIANQLVMDTSERVQVINKNIIDSYQMNRKFNISDHNFFLLNKEKYEIFQIEAKKFLE